MNFEMGMCFEHVETENKRVPDPETSDKEYKRSKTKGKSNMLQHACSYIGGDLISFPLYIASSRVKKPTLIIRFPSFGIILFLTTSTTNIHIITEHKFSSKSSCLGQKVGPT